MERLARWSSVVVAATLLSSVALGALAPASALGSFPGRDGVIAYASGAIWAVDLKTGYQLRLTAGPNDGAPAFSPSGNMIAFQRGLGKEATVYTVRADGSDATPLVSGSEPAFSPNGRELVFVRPSGLFLLRLQPSLSVRRLTHRAGDNEPRWSSTGTIVFERAYRSYVRRHGVVEHRLINQLDTIVPPSLRVLPLLSYEQPGGGFPEGESDMLPDWSPSGRSIAVALCNEAGPRRPPFATVPAFVFHGGCGPVVWAPAGGHTIAPGVGALFGKPQTACPHFIGEDAEISWQPVVDGTLRVPTVPCESRPPEPESYVLPSHAAPGSRTCYYDRRRHRRRCYTD